MFGWLGLEGSWVVGGAEMEDLGLWEVDFGLRVQLYLILGSWGLSRLPHPTSFPPACCLRDVEPLSRHRGLKPWMP